jgi:molybdenum cofactor cytidylyltransferase
MMAPEHQPGIVMGVVVLAAGASSRMGRPKLLLPWGDSTILGHLLAQWRELDARQIAIVCAEAHSELDVEMDRLGIPAGARIYNPRPEDGMFGSIRCAARWRGWSAELTHWIITLGDQPHVRLETLRALIEFGAGHPTHVCQPARNRRARHPVLLPGAMFAQLADAKEEHLKQFLLNRAEQRALREMDDPGLDFDLDRPEDYERALQLTGSASALKP